MLLNHQFAQIGSAKFRAPEVLFQPDLIGEESQGLHEVLANSIKKCDMDLRRTLYQNIVMAGGSTLFKGTKCNGSIFKLGDMFCLWGCLVFCIISLETKF